jgi:capsule biosynthesis phosphatase|tara:strand:+ start:484 stop:903 length:420 start_codon:yes stop_codon:yes gene_type:complete
MAARKDSSKRLIVDCDGVIADKNHGGIYANAGPLQHGIDQVNKLYDAGFEIVLYTARYGDRENGNMHRQYERGYVEWINWLEEHGVKYHHAYMGKPAGVLYIDDKAARVRSDDEDGWNQVWEEIGDLEGRDRYGRKIVS